MVGYCKCGQALGRVMSTRVPLIKSCRCGRQIYFYRRANSPKIRGRVLETDADKLQAWTAVREVRATRRQEGAHS